MLYCLDTGRQPEGSVPGALPAYACPLLPADIPLPAGVQDVAIKMVFHTDQEAREKFETEIAMLKFVSRDRNIVQFYGAGVRMSDPHAQGKVEPRLWLITEYMEVRCTACLLRP